MLSKILQYYRDRIVDIVTSHGGNTIRVFGSLACGEGTASSDVDLLIGMEPTKSLLDLIAMKQDLEDLLGRKVDVVTESSLSQYIRPIVLKEAVAL